MKVIFIGGKKRNGKDTHALALQSTLESQGLKVEIEHFATPLKSILIESGFVTGLEENKAIERSAYQIFGNDVMKKWFGNNVWADAMKILLDNKTDTDVVIIPDFRYPCEVDVISTSYDVICFHIERLNYVNDVDTHSSENALEDFKYDARYQAEGMEHVQYNVKRMVERIGERRS